MAKKKVEDPIEGEATQDQVVEETTTEETQAEQVSAEETVLEEAPSEDVVTEEPKPEKPFQIGADGNPILPAEEHVKNWGKMTTIPHGQESSAPESE
jgi:hypothetical protein